MIATATESRADRMNRLKDEIGAEAHAAEMALYALTPMDDAAQAAQWRLREAIGAAIWSALERAGEFSR